MNGLTNATCQDVAWCPKHQTAKWCCWFDGHCLNVKEYFAPFIKRKSFFLFTHASSPFPLETCGSFFKFNSFLFIYLFIFLNLIFYLFIRSLQVLLVKGKVNVASSSGHVGFPQAVGRLRCCQFAGHC